tara:strand:+ start:183 stop:806 length:624 start_codon:yes stop_codon:yes gene_type:complete
MHKQQIRFTKKVKRKFPIFFKGDIKVLDIGSYDINGSNRFLFDSNVDYLGLDIMEGPNVDIVSRCHEFNGTNESFDLVISTECFEHDMYYKESIKKIVELLKPGGLFVFTCATTGRPEHGTLRTTPENSATAIANLSKEEIEWKNYYKNLTKEDISEIIDLKKVFKRFKFSRHKRICDLYFYGIKHGENQKFKEQRITLSEFFKSIF